MRSVYRLVPALQGLLLSTVFMAVSCQTHQKSGCTTWDSTAAIHSAAFAKSTTLWDAFRQRFPFHIQTIGVSDPDSSDKSLVLVISEPPPHVSIPDIDTILACYSHEVTVRQHPLGYDGWVKDLVISLADVDGADIDSIKEHLNTYLFGTHYGLYSLTLKENYKSDYIPSLMTDVNYQISPSELDSWFCSDGAVQFDSGSISQILDQYNDVSSQLYYSKQRGFVAWVMPFKADIKGETEKIRRFALDADLIVGAITRNNNLAIIGRERRTSVFSLPPLRTETILQLAAANDKELAQSYERMNVMACKLSTKKDWAPIYLSDELLNTEYGSLLDITDQLLKSWSQNGETSYENFNYTPPVQWGFTKPLATVVADEFKVETVTFNWNTSGAVYQYSPQENYKVIGLNRVGSLPVSYIPDEQSSETNRNYRKVAPLEKTGYQFFSTQNDANLIRAAQYAALYQIFKANGITDNEPVSMAEPFNTFKPLEDATAAFFDVFRTLTDDQMDSLADRLMNAEALADLKPTEGGRQKSASARALADDKSSYLFILAALKELMTELDSTQEKATIIKLLTNRNQISSLDKSRLTESDLLLFERISAAMRETFFLKYHFDLLINTDSLVQAFVDYNANSPAQWIKTPSIVLSMNKNAFVSYGGHNIDAALLDVRFDPNVRRGAIAFEDGVFKINPEDRALLTADQLRRLGVEAKNADMNGISIADFSFDGSPPKPPRDINSVFMVDEVPENSPRGFIAGVHDKITVEAVARNSYLVDGKPVRSCQELQNILFVHASKDNAAIEFVGFDDDGAEVRLAGVQFQLQAQKGIDGTFVSLDEGSSLKLGNRVDGSGINRRTYVFEKRPVEATNAAGEDIIGVELTNKSTNRNIFVHVAAKTKSAFSSIRDAFKRSFGYAQNNDVDFVKNAFEEMQQSGLKKSDFAMILSNSKDCSVCRNKPRATGSTNLIAMR